MLNEAQAREIHELLALLYIYANNRFQIFENQEFYEAVDAFSEDACEYLHEVSQTLWENADIIDDFVAENPFDLPASSLDVVRPWKDALPAMALCVGEEAGRELYLVRDRLVALEAASNERRPMMPAFVSLTFLPYKGRIVEDCSALAYGFDEAQLPFVLEEEVAKARRKGIIGTEGAFVEFSRTVRRERLDQEMEELLAEASRESRRNAGEDISPAGFHRGVLAGLGREEREALWMEEAAASRDSDRARMREYYRKYAVNRQPPTTLEECLESLPKHRIEVIARSYGDKGFQKLRKRELAQRVAGDLMEGEGEVGSALGTLLAFALKDDFERMVQILEKGNLSFDLSDATVDVPYLHAAEPLLFLYRQGDKVTLAMPEDVREHLRGLGLDMDEVRRDVDRRHQALLVAENIGLAYGLIAVEDAYSELQRFGDAISFEQFSGILGAEKGAPYPTVDFWEHDGVTYIADPALLDVAPGDFEGKLSEVVDGILDGADPELFAEDPEAFEESIRSQLKAALEEDARRLVHDEAAMEDERLAVLEAHLNVPRRPYAEIAPDGDMFDALFDEPVVDELERYLNERIPDGADDLGFASRVAEQMVLGVVQSNADVGLLLEYAYSEGLEGCDDDMSYLVGLLSKLVNSLPNWMLNGWSPLGYHELATGRKLFLNDKGKPAKVGRNDPCPCGSGKKYKKCCGR